MSTSGCRIAVAFCLFLLPDPATVHGSGGLQGNQPATAGRVVATTRPSRAPFTSLGSKWNSMRQATAWSLPEA